MTTTKSVVLFTFTGSGHLTSMANLGNLIAGAGYSAVVVVVTLPWDSLFSSSIFDRFAADNPSISFHRLPTAPPPPGHPIAAGFHAVRALYPSMLSFLRGVPGTAAAVVLDMFFTDMFDAAAELGIPAYLFYTGGASSLSAVLSLATLKEPANTVREALIHVPGFQMPVPVSSVLTFLFDSDEVYDCFLHHFRRYTEADGILINTFEGLESTAVRSMSDGLSSLPPIYCIGPLVSGDGGDHHECLPWLDSQPEGSVVALIFGTMDIPFPTGQFAEIALGLERSEKSFLWVIRFSASSGDRMDSVLPEGFLARTAGRGLVVDTWVPQTAVLWHKAVGGFITHCGWNSILEAVTAGVPMVAWPRYAEQRINKTLLVDTENLAIEIAGHEDGLVTAAEVETKVRLLMDSDQGREMRERAAAAKIAATMASRDGGSSFLAAERFLKTLESTVQNHSPAPEKKPTHG